MRAIDEDITFPKFVIHVENGNLNDDNDNIIIPQRCTTTESNFVPAMYKHSINHNLFDEMCSSDILSARNEDVNEINKLVVTLLDSHNECIYTTVDSADRCDDNGLMAEEILPQYLNSLNPQNLPLHKLHLRIICFVHQKY